MTLAWELEKNKDGIKVYTRTVDGSDFKEYKASCKVEANYEEVLKVILRVTDYINWLPDCKESRILERKEKEMVVYQLIDCPWPTLDRDAVVKMKLSEKKGVYRVDFQDVSGFESERKNVVRVKTIGFWQVSKKGSSSEIIYQNHANPQGKVPAWLSNLFVVDAPYKTLKEIKAKFD